MQTFKNVIKKNRRQYSLLRHLFDHHSFIYDSLLGEGWSSIPIVLVNRLRHGEFSLLDKGVVLWLGGLEFTLEMVTYYIYKVVLLEVLRKCNHLERENNTK